ncbi:DNA-directed RNA polymerase subunit beta' [Candidatus Formimonas warabiya]|uniref:DNA-directed RNA polymerase subunit beta' n=1 Tax=Formimonas warabiya TaxID=1761012 RepID=A0A3G1KXL4_FORW1|nr:DNA-directed RNA polymerase subunit beta' [Candidatus Formimonas warabiya]ATW27109.1 DNA-directed RNA polymerase subunit beta' [Candidatus Formimonas warabiya]
MLDVSNFDRMRIGLASPEQIRQWSFGEVKKPETINYRTLKPERDGLFCEKIFGPTRDWECHCGKYKRVRYKGIVCDRCGVEVTRSKVRRERLGHIELAAPVSHIWYFKGIPSRMGLLLDMSPRSLEKVLYFVSYIVLDPGDTPLMKKQLLTETEYREYREKYGQRFQAGMGAEAIKAMLMEMELEKLAQELRTELKEVSGQRKIRAIRRLEVVEAFLISNNKPEWMVLDVVPVIPPELRPMVQLDGGRFATSDLNDLYRRVINRNNRLKRLLDLGAPDIIVRNEKRMLQEAVDALIDNGRRGRPVTGPGNRPLKSLSDMLKGKQGRFRQNLLGKRVDYSGRSVIVVGPELKFHQCGLPKEMALELFKPFVMKRLVNDGHAHNIKSAKRMVERVRPEVWDVLEEVIKEHPVLLNRAPTLHRLGIQAFEPVLVEGRALQIHPLVCTAYNADFDGDQMAVHVPLAAEAQAEARLLMLSAYNILNPKDGRPVAVPTQDMVLGSYYLTAVKEGAKGEGKAFVGYNEAYLAYLNGVVDLHARIIVPKPVEWDFSIENKQEKEFEIDEYGRFKKFETTVGRLIFNYEIPLPRALGYYNSEVDKKTLGKIVDRCYRKMGISAAAQLIDGIKKLGFTYSTRAGITIGVSDIQVPEAKKEIMANSEATVEQVEDQYRRGLITEEERYQKVIGVWNQATEDVTKALMAHLDKFNPIFMMANSGARGNVQQIRQLAGARGLMADPSGRIIDLPIKANFREGLTVLEFFISTHGARKGLADTALRTADSGYLTRRLVDVAQDVIVREDDCGDTQGVWVDEIKDVEPLAERIEGRIANKEIIDERTGEVLASPGMEISEEKANQIEAYLSTLPVEKRKVNIRSVLTCRTKYGVCRKCYGRNLATGSSVDIGEAVGIIAAQSIGEPGTQLTMRTFHTGGVAGDDITQGLPRVEELFEARKPKGQGIIAETDGEVKVFENKGKREIRIFRDGEEKDSYSVPYGSRLKVYDGLWVEAGDELTEGSVNPHDLLKVKGIRGVQMYLLREVQRVYRLQGVDINDKHIEVMIRQMLKKVKIEESGDTGLLPGALVDSFEFEAKNQEALDQMLQPAMARPVLLGITKASLATDSFLSAASFQETTRVLTDAAIKGKVDPLLGLKENVIIGKLIPAGTGMSRYRNIKVLSPDQMEEAEVSPS